MMIALESNSNGNNNMGMVMMEPRRGGIFQASSMEDVDHVNEYSCSSNSSSAAASSTTSSIGKDSDVSSNGNCDEDNGEVQSAFNGNTESSTMDCMHSLEEALPMRRGISKFYNGKSKSFTNLSEATSSPSPNIKEIAKPENAYSRRRRNLLAFNHRFGISKKPIASSKSTLALAVAMSSSESISSISEDSSSSSASKSPPPLPPLHPRSRTYHNNLTSPRQCFLPWHSFSVADLRQCAVFPDKTDH